ncbi:MmcQ/YjbR family DNA-binding protein [Maritalea porphyrae]|jgi:predicted DNA-binding protein (MmcQ/YjbR family)|uniref:MmcQ/YjbR family DNA-binding protein n=1 Tax=Maritalea porphyrae TaxID=880732 RepID=UPI0022AE86C0|nr:MmcQ/YjbR family DNA-binding protein [Maritalea porphyrae]MCZ4271862.1 MmcQ/YjbR family DNA-binding protein [Maritalea porphyrae]
MLTRVQFEVYCFSLPKVTHVVQWGNASVFKIGGKIFAIYSRWDDADQDIISFKCSDQSFAILPTQEGIRPAKYLARAKWVQISHKANWDEETCQAYIKQAYDIITAKLTKKTREELEI